MRCRTRLEEQTMVLLNALVEQRDIAGMEDVAQRHLEDSHVSDP